MEQPTKVDVSGIEIEDGSASASIAIKGSVFDGQTLRYAFVERKGRWKFDEILGFVNLDPDRLILRAGRDGMLRAESSREAENVACWIGRMERMSDEELERLLLGDSPASGRCTVEMDAI